MSTKFDQAFNYVVANEGAEYTDDPNDPGGPTRYGIIQDDLSRFLGRPASPDEVKNMSLDTAKQIYIKFYWTPMHLDKIVNQSVMTCLFDMGMNRGLTGATIMAQKALNQCGDVLVVDGHLGPKTLQALNTVNPHQFVIKFEAVVVQYYENILANHPNEEVFRKGWMNRAKRLLTLA